MTSDKRRILFVDDEPAILAAIQNLLYKDRKRWDLAFADSGESALDACRTQAFDVVVSDMRMPKMDGATLLAHIKEEFPATARIMLSGQAEREAIGRALPVLHQLLSKPCDAATLRTALERSLDVSMIASDERISAVVGRIERLPSPPGTYFEIKRVMESPTAGISDIAKVVLKDPALAAKTLQIVNTAYFGARKHISSIDQAVSMLGSERLRFIALSTSVFTSGGELSPWEMELQEDCMRTSAVAKGLIKGADAEDAFAAGLLKDVGHLVLARGVAAEYAAVRARAPNEVDGLAVERELLGATHAEVGACLLALWGLPNRIVDVVRWHHDPSSAQPENREIASAVYVAGAIARGGTAELDLEMLERAGTKVQVKAWLASAGAA